jgi:hypothetical protein
VGIDRFEAVCAQAKANRVGKKKKNASKAYKTSGQDGRQTMRKTGK